VPLCLIGRALLGREGWEIARVCLVGGLGDEVRRRLTIEVSVCIALGSKAVWGRRMAGLLLYECDNRFAWGETALARVVVQVNLGSRKRGSSAADLEFAMLMLWNVCNCIRVDINRNVNSSRWKLRQQLHLQSDAEHRAKTPATSAKIMMIAVQESHDWAGSIYTDFSLAHLWSTV
jgi:hypothetical protein